MKGAYKCSECDTEVGMYEDESFLCKVCGEPVCESCQAPYNQFTQIDFTCHESCTQEDRS